jgi:hypothetical protein
MPTPTTAFADAAAKYGEVDPEDIEAVQKWFAEDLPTLSPDVIEQVLRDLLARDGSAAEREIIAVYPERAPLPSLGSSPPLAPPLLAEDWQRLLRRVAARLRGRGSNQ